MLYDYIISNYSKSEPIFLSELKGYSKEYIRQEMKRLTDNGKIERVYNGVYIIPYMTILGTKGKMNIDTFVDKKFLRNNEKISGFVSGLQLANLLGFTTQNPSCYEVVTNEATTKQRKINIDGMEIIIYKPVVDITNANLKELQFLDLMLNLDKYSELTQKDLQLKLKMYINENNLDFKVIKECIVFYPDKIFKNFYYGGIISELV